MAHENVKSIWRELNARVMYLCIVWCKYEGKFPLNVLSLKKQANILSRNGMPQEHLQQHSSILFLKQFCFVKIEFLLALGYYYLIGLEQYMPGMATGTFLSSLLLVPFIGENIFCSS